MIKLNLKYRLARQLLSHPRLDDFIEAGFIGILNIRNCRIINDYQNLRKTHKHLDALDELSKKYFLSRDRLLSILYK